MPRWKSVRASFKLANFNLLVPAGHVSLVQRLPAGVVQHGERWVESLPLELPGLAARCYLRGKCDSLLEFADGTYGVVDFKTSSPKPEHVAFYGRQLHAYAHALENAAPGKFCLKPVTRLGLFIVEPVAIQMTPEGRIAYVGDVTWQEIPRDDGGFTEFLGEVVCVLEKPEPPEPGEKCTWCRYREDARRNGL